MDLELTRCRLRPWQPGDRPSLVRNADNRNVWRNLRDAFPHPYTAADAEAWLAHAQAGPPHFELAIEVEGQAAGGIGLRPGDDVFRRSAEFGYWLGEAHWGRGIMTEVVRAYRDQVFTACEDLCRLWAGVFAWNAASARVLQKAGFTFEGCQRHAVFKDGVLVDRSIYADLR